MRRPDLARTSGPWAENGRRHVLDLQKLATFQMVATTGNFTRAAVQLGYSQSSVTIQVKLLERQLGVRLFQRQRFSRDIVLTEAGRCTLSYARRLLALATETVRAARQFEKQRILTAAH